MRKSLNPTDMLERYLQAVRFWLPKGPHEDILAELSEDLHSQMEEKEGELGRPIEEPEMSAILRRCGSPLVVASRYQSQQYLIGPALFPVYKFVLKMVLLWILAPVLLFIITPVNLANTNGNWGLAVARTLGTLWSGGFIAAGTITLVFAILEATKVPLGLADKWDPRSLPPVTLPQQRASQKKTLCELAFAFMGLVWVLLLPTYPVLILGPAAAFLTAGPLWHTFYLPCVLLVAYSVIRLWIGLIKPQWKIFLPATELLNTALTMLLLYFLLAAAVRSSSAEVLVFVGLADPATATAQLHHVAAIVNASVFLALAATWLGLSIAGIIQTWEVIRLFRNRASLAAEALGPMQKMFF